jgi:hypothetical protein
MARQRGSGSLIRLIAGCRKMQRAAVEFSKDAHLDYMVFKGACHTKQVFWLPLFTKFNYPELTPKTRRGEGGLLHSLNDIIISRTARP